MELREYKHDEVFYPTTRAEIQATSLTQAECYELFEECLLVVERCKKENITTNKRLGRLWPFFKLMWENQLASIEYYKLADRSGMRTIMSARRAHVHVRWMTELLKTCIESEHIPIPFDCPECFQVILVKGADMNAQMKSSWRLVAEVHPIMFTIP